MFSLFGKKSKNSVQIDPVNTMKNIVEDFNDIEPLASFFKIETGITFEKQKSILKSKLISFCKNQNIFSFKKCLEQVQSNQLLKQKLINYLTTNESYFYREFRQIQDFVNSFIKDVQRTHHAVDILCAPCSTGEEVYSIVIALLEAGVPEKRFNIVGVDINTEALESAKSGIYNERNISKLPVQLLKKYFNITDSKYYLTPRVKQCVNLKSANIFSLSFKTMGKFDYIFSRNMLIYFDKETKIRAKQILEGLLKHPDKPVYFGHADLF